MFREVALFALGSLLLVVNVVDIIWTTLGTHGGGPISGPLTAFVWKIELALHKRRPHHRMLSFAGSAMLIIQLFVWTSMLWLGWFCIFQSGPNAIVDTQTHRPADVISRLYFTAYAVSTMGNGDFQPSSSPWRILTAIATLGGLGTVTLAITFLLNILPAVVEQRQLGSYLSDLGGTPHDILGRAWTGETFDSLNDHLVELTKMVHRFTEQHLAYPVLHYFHSEHERTSSSLRLAALNELMLLLQHGVAEEVRPGPMVILPLRDALDGLAGVIIAEFVRPADDAPPLPDLDLLRERGIPTVSDAEFAKGALERADSRRFFAGFLADDGWPWERVYDTSKVKRGAQG